MEPISFTLVQLRGLIGVEVAYLNTEYTVVEVIEQPPTVVLQSGGAAIQTDQHGGAHRRVPVTLSVPILTECGSEWSPVFLELDLLNGLAE